MVEVNRCGSAKKAAEFLKHVSIKRNFDLALGHWTLMTAHNRSVKRENGTEKATVEVLCSSVFTCRVVSQP